MEGSDNEALHALVDAWLEPLGDPPCGEDVVYDISFLQLTKAAAGKPGTQFKDFTDAEPPDWRGARGMAEELFGRTRDLRVAVLWARALLALEGAGTLPESLRLVHGLLERFWDDLHPVPEDGDAYERINALIDMCSQAGLYGDLRQGLIFRNRAIGELRVRQVELALGLIEPRDGEYPPERMQIEGMLADAAAEDAALAAFPAAAIAQIDQITELMRERVGYGSAPDLQSLRDLLSAVAGLMPREGGAARDDGERDEDEAAAHDEPIEGRGATRARPARGGVAGAIESREDALRAIDLICAYLERTEPTNPAQLLLRRARRLMSINFLQLVRELAPESLNEVARIMGVSADEIPMVSHDD